MHFCALSHGDGREIWLLQFGTIAPSRMVGEVGVFNVNWWACSAYGGDTSDGICNPYCCPFYTLIPRIVRFRSLPTIPFQCLSRLLWISHGDQGLHMPSAACSLYGSFGTSRAARRAHEAIIDSPRRAEAVIDAPRGGSHRLAAPRGGTSVLCLPAYPAWLWVLRDDRHGCPGPRDGPGPQDRSRPRPEAHRRHRRHEQAFRYKFI